MTDSIIDFLNCTAEFSEGREKPAPSLDTQLWYGQQEQQGTWFEGGLARDKKAPGAQGMNRPDERTTNYMLYSKTVMNPLSSSRV